VARDGQAEQGDKPQPPLNAEKSDEAVVAKSPAKTWVTPVESEERRAEAEGKSAPRNAHSTQGEEGALTFLERIGSKAIARDGEKFTNLLSHVKVPLLRAAYTRLSKKAAPGVDGVSWQEYGVQLEERLADLQDRIHRGSYHPQPVRRVHIPKGEGATRPIGVPALEDKLVQQAVRMILEPIYERQFVGLSYGFRPGRSTHDALDALATTITRRKVNWVLDADIRSYFDTIDHGWLRKFIERRIGDSRLIRLLMKWLKAGVLEDGELHEVEEGTPQGGGISPLLANIFLHYVLDIWFLEWRKTKARGEVYLVRYADDFIIGCQYEEDVHAMLSAVRQRLAQHGLELHPDKTRVIRFGRFARVDCGRDGLHKPSTFDFLGFTHICGVSRAGRFQLKRRTKRKKRLAKLASLKEEIERRRHEPVPEQFKWLKSVLDGHYNYYGVPTNIRALHSMRHSVRGLWHRSLQRRSQRAQWTTATRRAFDELFKLPTPTIRHMWPDDRFARR
jgi:group II intron reverse transcriptase/maturase